MGFFKTLKTGRSEVDGSTENNNYGSPSTGQSSSNQKQTQIESLYRPPPGPPPGWNNYNPPPDPSSGRMDYAPPLGPPPSHAIPSTDPPPYHDWTVIPDTSLLPPPPEIGHDVSPSGNASSYDADRAKDWCRKNPLIRPHQPTQQQHAMVKNGEIQLLKPREYTGALAMIDTGTWRGGTNAGSKDSSLLTSSPLFFACADSPLTTRAPKTIYFEIKLRSLGRGRGTDQSSIAIGFCSIPYPAWRMPGWERGSLGVHGDDGRKYVNDSWGGKDFTSPFIEGETVGLGMTFSNPDISPTYGAQSSIGTTSKVKIFMTRGGRFDREWDLHEELDASNDLGIEGLDGQFDLYGAVGVFGGVEFDVFFSKKDWLWQPT